MSFSISTRQMIPLETGNAVGRGWTKATGRKPLGVTWHWTAGSTLHGCDKTIGGSSPEMKGRASAHYGIGRSFSEGVSQYVSLENRSFHAGKNQIYTIDGQRLMRENEKGTRRTIGIETVNVGHDCPRYWSREECMPVAATNARTLLLVQPWTDEQVEMMIHIGKIIQERWPHIRPEYHHGHCDLCPGYREDVAGFPWVRVLQGIYNEDIEDIWTNLQSAGQRQKALQLLGYDLGDSGPNSDGVDGRWGRISERELNKFQMDSGIYASNFWTVFCNRAVYKAFAERSIDPTELASVQV